MSKGEKARLEIEPEWAYGKKGQPDAKYPFFPFIKQQEQQKYLRSCERFCLA
jgi:FKBP-type peptidyl-prolyl cis-trans isomerase 2